MAQKKTLVLTICMVILGLFLPLILFADFNSFFLGRFQHYDVYSGFAQTETEVQQNFTSVMDYLNYRNSDLNVNFFSDEDIIHLQDVRLVLNVMRVLTGLSFVVIFAYLYQRKFSALRQSMRTAGIATLVMLILIGLYGVFNFDQAFVQLHELVFWNDYWSLSPVTSNLIRYFPQAIFFELFIIYLLTTVLLAILGILLTRKSKQL